jgi:hypothetical protein
MNNLNPIEKSIAKYLDIICLPKDFVILNGGKQFLPFIAFPETMSLVMHRINFPISPGGIMDMFKTQVELMPKEVEEAGYEDLEESARFFDDYHKKLGNNFYIYKNIKLDTREFSWDDKGTYITFKFSPKNNSLRNKVFSKVGKIEDTMETPTYSSSWWLINGILNI